MRLVNVTVSPLGYVPPSVKFSLHVSEELTLEQIKAQVLTKVNEVADDYTAPVYRLNGLGVWEDASLWTAQHGTVQLTPPPERDAKVVRARQQP